MAVEPWPTVVVGAKEYWEVDIKARVAKESDPNAGVLFLVGTPNGGIANVGPLVQGDAGQHAEIDEEIVITDVLEYDDPTSDSMSWETVVPPDDDTPGVYKLHTTIRKGPSGEDGDTVLDPNDYDTPLAGQILVVNDDLDAFVLQNQKVATRHWPASFTSVSNSAGNATVGTVSIPAKTYDYSIIVAAEVIITGSGPDVAVDLICRMGDATTGNIVARCHGIAGAKDRLIITSAPPAGSSDAFNKVTAGNAMNFYLRTERQSGTDTYSASDSTMLYSVWAIAL